MRKILSELNDEDSNIFRNCVLVGELDILSKKADTFRKTTR